MGKKRDYGGNRVFHKERSKPGINFIIYIPLRFTISAPLSLHNNFKKYMQDNNKDIPALFHRKMLKLFGVNKIDEVVSKNSIIRKKTIELRSELKDLMGLSDAEFSSWARGIMEEELKNGN